MKEKATIYDLFRVCRTVKCERCPLWDDDSNECGVNYSQSNSEKADKLNDAIIKWCKEHPVKTRQDKFLEMFPNAIKDNGIIDICPLVVESGYECLCKTEPITDCNICHSKYWLAEVEENE